jgi:hypothetical protein
MRRGFGIAGALVTLVLLVIVGVVAYNIGWSDGANTHLPATAQGAVGPGYYYGPHFFGGGFAIFGIFWFLLILFGLFWLFRLAFWGFGARRLWGYGRGGGYGPGHSFEERAQEWHRRQHGEAAPPPSTPGTTPPPPPSDTRSV